MVKKRTVKRVVAAYYITTAVGLVLLGGKIYAEACTEPIVLEQNITEAFPDKVIIINDEPQETADKEVVQYLEKCVEAEAGNQGKIGKALVTDVILNRVDSDLFADDIVSVINEKNQFACVGNGMIDRVKVSDETREVVQEEIESRIDSEILYFRTKHFHRFGTPVYQHKDHYFSK